jgi:catechol 2,3-dioxygenase-like lactoylglutathione lyase family enzyme
MFRCIPPVAPRPRVAEALLSSPRLPRRPPGWRAEMKFDQVGLRVTNLDRSLRFYTQALGLKIKARGDTRAWGGGLWVQLADPRSHRVVELNWYPRGSIFASRFAVGDGVDHLDFTMGVATHAALEREYRRLLRAGARPTRYSPDTTQGWMASVRDPDGIWITIGRRPTAAERKALRLASRASRSSRPQSRWAIGTDRGGGTLA